MHANNIGKMGPNYDNGSMDPMLNVSDLLDYETIPYLGEKRTLPVYEVVLKVILFTVIIIIALVGNLLIIVSVIRQKQMQTTTNFYIANLAVADLLVTIFCTWVHLVNNLNNNNWVLGRFFCKFNTFSQVFCLVASSLSLSLIAYDRFFGIVFALKAHMSRRKARFSIGVIWMCSFIIAAPLLKFRDLNVRRWMDYTESWCDDSWPVQRKHVYGSNMTIDYMPSRTIYFTFVSAVLYFLPMVAMSISYTIIIIKLCRKTMPGEQLNAGLVAQQKRKRKVIVMLTTIMAVFGICWLPYQIVILHSEHRETRTELEEWWFTMQFIAGCLAYSNAALYPLIFAGFTRNFKKAMVKMKTDMRRLSLRRMSLSTFPTREIIGTSTSRRLSLPTLRTRSPIATSIDGKSMELPWVNGAMSMDSACPLIKPNTSALKTSITSTKLRLTVEQDVAAWQPENVHHRQPRVNIKKMFFRNKTVEKRQDSYNLDNVPKRHSIGSLY